MLAGGYTPISAWSYQSPQQSPRCLVVQNLFFDFLIIYTFGWYLDSPSPSQEARHESPCARASYFFDFPKLDFITSQTIQDWYEKRDSIHHLLPPIRANWRVKGRGSTTRQIIVTKPRTQSSRTLGTSYVNNSWALHSELTSQLVLERGWSTLKHACARYQPKCFRAKDFCDIARLSCLRNR